MRNPPVIILGARACLRVRYGALEIVHGATGDKRSLRIDVDEDKPHTILFDSHGEFLTGEALRWCARYGISLVLPDGPGAVLTFIHSAMEASDAARLADTSPTTIRAQCSANSLEIAKDLVRAKVASELEAIEKDRSARLCKLAEWKARIAVCRSVPELLIVEAKASADYWRAYAGAGLREAKGGNLPRSWLRYSNRQKGSKFLGSKNASHPINAALNYAYVVEAGRLAKSLHSLGLALQIGFLHSDKKGRNSLVWDAIEPIRVEITERVFRYIELREFKRSDFVQTTPNTFRLHRDIIQSMLRKVTLPQARIDEGAQFMIRVIERHKGC